MISPVMVAATLGVAEAIITESVRSVNYIGSGLRDALDPRIRGR